MSVRFSRNRSRSRSRSRRRRKPIRRKVMTVGRVKRIVGAELKFRDLGVGPIPISAPAGDITLVSNIFIGDSASQRDGNWIKPVVWMGTIVVEGNTASAEDTSQFRVGAVVWKENQDVDPLTLTKLMQDVVAPHQQFNIQSKGSFKVLWSRTGIVSNNTENPQFQKILRFYVRPSMKILFDGDSFRKFHLFIFGYSNIDTAAEPPVYSFDTRLRYTDS